MADDAMRPPGRPGPGGPAGPRRPNALVRTKLPLWLVLALALAIVVLFLFILAGKSSVSFGPGVSGADRVDVAICYPDDAAKQKKLDIVKAEDTLRDALVKAGAKDASVRLRRTPDCPATPTPTPTPSPSPSR